MVFRHCLIAFHPTNVIFDGSNGLGAAMMLGGVNKQLFPDGRMIRVKSFASFRTICANESYHTTASAPRVWRTTTNTFPEWFWAPYTKDAHGSFSCKPLSSTDRSGSSNRFSGQGQMDLDNNFSSEER